MGLLRLLLAISVVIQHTYPLWGYSLIFGDIPVRSFFIISGFYMSLILREKYPARDYRLFITNRFLRIYPLYWFVLILTLVFFFLYIRACPYTFTTLLSDVTLLFRPDYFVFNHEQSAPMMIGQAWTLIVELLFYLIAPFLVRRNTFILVITGTVSLLIRFFVYHYEVVHGFQPKDTFFPGELIFFILGIISYNFYNNMKRQQISRLILSIAIGTLFTFTFFYQYLADYAIRYVSLKEVLYYSAVTILLPYIFLLSKNFKVDRVIGELSYPVYIWHAFISLVLTKVIHMTYSTSIYTLLVIIFTLGVSVLSVQFLILPLDVYREKRLARVDKKTYM